MLVPGPLHPYGIQRLIKHWGKDKVVNVGQRANLYKTIKRLHEAGLIAVRQTERDQQYPERTVYELTDAGHDASGAWITGMLPRPRHEYPRFPPQPQGTGRHPGPAGARAARQVRRARGKPGQPDRVTAPGGPGGRRVSARD